MRRSHDGSARLSSVSGGLKEPEHEGEEVDSDMDTAHHVCSNKMPSDNEDLAKIEI